MIGRTNLLPPKVLIISTIQSTTAPSQTTSETNADQQSPQHRYHRANHRAEDPQHDHGSDDGDMDEDGLKGVEANRTVAIVGFQHQEDNPGDEPQDITKSPSHVILHAGRGCASRRAGCTGRAAGRVPDNRSTSRTELPLNSGTATWTERHVSSGQELL